MKTLSIEDIPAITAGRPMDEVSEKYSFIPTTKVINDLSELGWEPSRYGGSQKSHFGRHLIRFRHADISPQMVKVGDEIPEIVLLNSHDCTSSFQMKAGIFRLACSNGLIVAEEMFKTLRIKHIHYSLDQVKMAVSQFAGGLPSIMDKVSEMKRVFLSESQINQLANHALFLRFPDANTIDVPLRSALQRIRAADSDNSLWTVMNVLQENILRGRMRTRKGRKVKAITETSRVVEFNQKLFSAACSLLI